MAKFCEICSCLVLNDSCTDKKCVNNVKVKKVKAENGFKICPTCKQELPALDNYFHRDGHDYFDYCWNCQTGHQKDWNNGRSVKQDY